MLNFRNKDTREMYQELNRFYCDQVYFSKDPETITAAQRFFYVQEYALNNNYNVHICGTKGDDSGFDVAFYMFEYDEYGNEISDAKFAFNGGFINHGTKEKPSWSLHT